MTISAGAYNFGTSSFDAEDATYSLALQQNGKIKVTGVIPLFSEEGGFPAGNRFTVKLENEDITAQTDLPSGDIVMSTNTQAAGGYNVYDKTAFEEDGSLIAIFTIAEGTLASYDREVIVAWTKAGDELAETDYKTYTFDLSDATLATE